MRKKENKKDHRLTVYFAHSIQDYNTRKEKVCLKFFKESNFKVINPNGLKLGDVMTRYYKLIDACDIVVVVSQWPSDIVGRGVFLEIKYAMKIKVPVFLYDGSFFCLVNKAKVYNPNDWRRHAFIVTKSISL